MAANATETLLTVCADALADLGPGPARDAVADTQAALLGPLRVAVAGRVSSGKSTLVNALIGERIARTDAGECTKVVAWFRYGDSERIEVHPRKGEPVPVPFADARKAMPATFAVAAADAQRRLGREVTVSDENDIGHLSVYLKNEMLRDVTIIDTPGLEAATQVHSAKAADFLGFDDASTSAVAGADALMYLSASNVKLDAKEYLEQFRGAFRGGNLSALNAVAVLSKADVLSSDLRNPWPDARKIAASYAAKFRSLVVDLLPVITVLAETTATHALTEEDARNLEKLAPATEADRMRLLLSADFFLNQKDSPVDAEVRKRLMDRLYVFGLHVCFDAIAAGRHGVSQLEAALADQSGLAPLREVVEGTFTRMAAPMKAGAAMAKLEKVSYFAEPDNASALRSIRKGLEAARLDPEMRQLDQIRSMQLVAAQDAVLSEVEQDQLRRLTVEITPAARLGKPEDTPRAELFTAAKELGRYWNGREQVAFNRHVESVARTAKVAAMLLEESLRVPHEPDVVAETP